MGAQTSGKEKFDIIVLGAGVIGLSCAYHIKSTHPELSILVVDKAATSAQGDTGNSIGAVRNMFSSQVNMLLADTSIDFYKHVQEDLGFNLNLELIGYLWLLTEEQYEVFSRVGELMKSSGVEFKVWERSDLRSMIPSLKLDFSQSDEQAQVMGLKSIYKGLQGIKCGIVSPELIAAFYEREFRRLGGSIRYGTEAVSIVVEPVKKLGIPREPLVWQEKKILGIETRGNQLLADKTVIALGRWASRLLDPIGLDSHMKPKKRQIFQLAGSKIESLLNTPGFNKQGILPFTILPKSHVLLRPVKSEKCFWIEAADDVGRPFMFEEDPKAEEDYYRYGIYPILTSHFPQFKDVKPSNMWAGQYDINTMDACPCIFENHGATIVSGLSGSGIMKADAVGRIAAALYGKEEYTTLYGGEKIKTSRLGILERDVGKERFVI